MVPIAVEPERRVKVGPLDVMKCHIEGALGERFVSALQGLGRFTGWAVFSLALLGAALLGGRWVWRGLKPG